MLSASNGRAPSWPTGQIGVDVQKSNELALVPIRPVVVTMLAILPEEERPAVFSAASSGRRHVLGPLPPSPEPPRPRDGYSGQADKKAAELGVWKDPRSLHRYQHVKPEAIPGRHFGTIFDMVEQPDEAKPCGPAAAPAITRQPKKHTA